MGFKNEYTLLEEIGQGAMATVNKATQRSLERLVAIKRILPHLSKEPEFVSRFEREAKASGHLKHVNILQIIDFGRDDEGAHFIVMEYVDGPNLAHVLQSCDRLPLEVTLSIAIQILNGLDHAHSNGVIHRDVKPANIMVTTGGVAKITDFGIAQAARLPSLTMAGLRLGTPLYMSPEQAAGRALDHRSDLFSAGIVLYQMLTRKPPFTGDTAAVMYKIVNEPITPIRSVDPQIPEPVAAAVERALEKDVTRRFFDAGEFAYALEDAAFTLGLRIGQRTVKEFLKSTMGLKAADTAPPKPPTSTTGRRIRSTGGVLGERPTAAILPLQGCFGCHVNLLDLHERITSLVKAIDLQYCYLMDVKEMPEVDMGIVEGCVANVENEERLQALREKCVRLVTLGSCACFGGVPGLRNLFSPASVLSRAYEEAETNAADGGARPDAQWLPALTPRVRAVHEVVEVEASIPGCPAPPALVLRSLQAVIEGKPDAIPDHNLCHECPRKHHELLTPQRKLIADDVLPLMSLPEIDPELCFLEQGVPCLGLATREGCGARCMVHNVPCHGCMGPARNAQEMGGKWIDALASLLPGGVLRYKHDLTGSAYRYTLPTSMIPERRD